MLVGGPVNGPAKGSAINHVQAIAPLSFCQKKTAPTFGMWYTADCLCTRLKVSQSTSCHTEHLSNLDTIQLPSKITLKALEVTCSECAKRGYPTLINSTHLTFWTSMSLSPFEYNRSWSNAVCTALKVKTGDYNPCNTHTHTTHTHTHTHCRST